MNSTSRVTQLAVTGVVVAGLSQAGWLGLLWAASDGTAGLAAAWVPVALQVGLTGVLAAAVGWQIHRSIAALQTTLRQLQQQAEALEQGRFVVVDKPATAEAQALVHSFNTAVRQVQSALDSPGPAAVETLRRTGRTDVETGLDSRFSFLGKLTDRLADPRAPETALLMLRLLPHTGTGDQATPAAATSTDLAELTELLGVYPQRVQGAFVGRLGDSDFGLCLPAHGLVEESASSLMAAAQAAPRPLRCAIGGVDHLGGVSLGSALAQLDSAADAAAGLGPTGIECRSPRHAGVPIGTDHGGRRAIVDALRSGQFRLGEYPVLDSDGQVLHLECPLRLRLSAGGPFEHAHRWLAEASRYRLMTLVDLAALELALAACAGDGQGRCVHVAAESLATAGFVSAVRARLEASPEAAAHLWIEISELAFERLPPRLRNAGTAWRRCGARVGIEHAGAALRHLVQLDDLELDYVKVDRAFVQGLAADATQRDRAQALVTLVHEFGARVIAEGCDDDADLTALWALGFDGATGLAATRLHHQQKTDSRPVEPVIDSDQAMSPA